MSRLAEITHLLLRTGQVSRLREPELFSKALEGREALEAWARTMGYALEPVQSEGEVVGMVLVYRQSLLPGQLRGQLDGRSSVQRLAGATFLLAELLDLLGLVLPHFPGLPRGELEKQLALRLSAQGEDPLGKPLSKVLAGMERLLERRRKEASFRVHEGLELLKDFLERGERLGVFLIKSDYIRPLPAYLWLLDLVERQRDRLEALGLGQEEEGEDAEAQ